MGYPNAGKSSFLGAVSAAAPTVGAYPFTTLHPSVGTVEFDDFTRATIADIPGWFCCYLGVGWVFVLFLFVFFFLFFVGAG